MLLPSCHTFSSFARMPLRQREAIVQFWAASPIPLLRKARLAMHVLLTRKPMMHALCAARSALLSLGVRLERMQQAFKGIRSLITSTLFNATDSKGRNPLWPAIMYEGALLMPNLLPTVPVHL